MLSMVWVKELDGFFLVISQIKKTLSSLEGRWIFLGVRQAWSASLVDIMDKLERGERLS